MTKIRSMSYIALAAALLSMPAVALAQSAPASAPTTAAPANNAVATRVEARIKQLHSQLGITQTQEPQWEKFAQTMRDNARDMDQVLAQRTQQFASMNAVQDMQSYEQVAEAHVQHLQKLVPAFQTLYDSMSPEQKQKADQVFRARSQARAQAGAAPGR